MRYLLSLLLAVALVTAGAVPTLAAPGNGNGPPGGFPPGLCNAPDPRLHPGHAVRTHLPFPVIDCSNGGPPNPDP